MRVLIYILLMLFVIGISIKYIYHAWKYPTDYNIGMAAVMAIPGVSAIYMIIPF